MAFDIDPTPLVALPVDLALDLAADRPAPVPRPAPPVALRYGGFRTTPGGREYTLSVAGERDPRVFVVLIPHEVFASRQASFQDAPALCYAKLQRELRADAELLPGSHLVLSPAELAAHRMELEKKAPGRRRRSVPG